MLSEKEIMERAIYCFCVYTQLCSLQRNELISPFEYRDYLKKSSLQLGDDEFIGEVIEEGLLMGLEDGGVSSLIYLYEGFVRAFCEVLEIDVEEVVEEIKPEVLQSLADEVSLKSQN